MAGHRRLTKSEKEIIAEHYRHSGNYAETARQFGISDMTVKRITSGIVGNGDEVGTIKDQADRERAAHAHDVLQAFLDQDNKIKAFMGKALDCLNDQERLKNATLSQITTAMGILLDKYVTILRLQQNDSMEKVDEIISALNSQANCVTENEDTTSDG